MDELTVQSLELLQALASQTINTAQFTVFQSFDKIVKNFLTFNSPIFDSLVRTPVSDKIANWDRLVKIIADTDCTRGEGEEADQITYDYEPCSARIKGQGLGGQFTDEMQNLDGKNNSGILANQSVSTLATLKEGVELQILGGTSTNIDNPDNPVLSTEVDNNIGHIPAATYTVKVCALTMQALYKRVLDRQVNGLNLISKGGYTALSSSTIVVPDANSVIEVSIPSVDNAFAYAVFVGNNSTQTLQIITSGNKTTLTKLVTGGQAASTITENKSGSVKAFDGITTQCLAGGGHFSSMDMEKFTSNGEEGIQEIDDLLEEFNRLYDMSPTKFYVGSEVHRSFTKAYLANGNHVITTPSDGKVTVNQQVEVYRNPHRNLAPIVIETHPLLPPNVLIAITEQIPYQNTKLVNIMDVAVLKEYHGENFAKTPDHVTRFDITGESAFRHFMPKSLAVITNIGKGIS
jgi:hypothetical protein